MSFTTLFYVFALIIGRSCPTSDLISFREPDHHLNGNKNFIDISLANIPLGTPDPENEMLGVPLTPADFHNAKKVSVDPPPRDKLGGDPIESAGLFEGDIAGVSADMVRGRSKGKSKNAITDTTLRWPSSIIPYVISASFSQYDRSVIARAILEYHNKTCLRFVPRTNQRDYIHSMPGTGCSSNVGRTGGSQPVSLGSGCVYVGIVIHELMHAAGFWHEQSRADRDAFITINWNNIIDGSVMHYGAFAFAKNRGRPTITAKKSGTELGQRRGFSEVDLMKLNKLYQCGTSGTASTGTTTMAPLLSTELPGKCEDSHGHCMIWLKMGECAKNAAWMNINCRKSCKQCAFGCTNLNVFCDKWAQSGECSKNVEYMPIYCPKACGVCDIVTSNAGCVNENRYCSAWSQRDHCKANPDYMMKNCKKSCKVC